MSSLKISALGFEDISTLLLRRIVLAEGITEGLATEISLRTGRPGRRKAGALLGSFNGRFDFADIFAGQKSFLRAEVVSERADWWRRRKLMTREEKES